MDNKTNGSIKKGIVLGVFNTFSNNGTLKIVGTKRNFEKMIETAKDSKGYIYGFNKHGIGESNHWNISLNRNISILDELKKTENADVRLYNFEITPLTAKIDDIQYTMLKLTADIEFLKEKPKDDETFIVLPSCSGAQSRYGDTTRRIDVKVIHTFDVVKINSLL